jgi:bifunctional DNA-binding transcriptional regulator/antitoxin component of YhaV-PrlF toxin-antitoxin module
VTTMPVEVKKLDIEIGDVVEIGERRYDVVSDKAGGVALEPAITKTVAELRAEAGGRPLTPEEFDELFGDLPRDGEG